MIELFVPGRLCLFGEHSDWAAEYMSPEKGYCVVTGTNQGIYARAGPLNGYLRVFSNCLILGLVFMKKWKLLTQERYWQAHSAEGWTRHAPMGKNFFFSQRRRFSR